MFCLQENHSVSVQNLFLNDEYFDLTCIYEEISTHFKTRYYESRANWQYEQ